jgi:hypothetical protein
VTLDAFLKPWLGIACRHIADDAAYDILDFRLAGQGKNNRWNVYDEPMLSLTSDHRVAIAEFARHFEEDTSQRMRRPKGIGRRAVARRVFAAHCHQFWSSVMRCSV